MKSDDQEPIPSLGMEDVREAVLAAAEAYGSSCFIIVGRASLAVTMPESDPLLRATMDVDLFPPWDESKAAVWAAADLSIGRLSPFRREHGFYVERVAEWTTRQLLPGWEQRVSAFEVNGIQARAIHPFDLICAKLQAGRPKDRAFIKKALELGVVNLTEIEAFFQDKSGDEALLTTLTQRLNDALDFTEEED
jgi:hypothetical protein